jgi:hypothetical protein
MAAQDRIVNALLGLVGAVAGGALGFFAFGWLLNRGYLAGMLPGGLLGLGCGLLSRRPSLARGIACGVAGLAVSLLAEAYYHYFLVDPSLQYFFAHLRDLPSVDWFFIIMGTLLAFWIGKDSGYSRVAHPAARP